MSLADYRATMRETADPKDLERRLLNEATVALERHAEDGFSADLVRAVHRNREIWGAFLGDLAGETNALPDQLRANLISLALWVQQHSGEVMARREEVGPLIEINRMVIAGLSGQTAETTH